MSNSSETSVSNVSANNLLDKRVTGDHWKVHPMENPATAAWNLSLEGSDVVKLLRGYQPDGMEGRWMCRAKGPDEQGNISVDVYRSWTGRQQLQLTVATSVKDYASDVPQRKITEIIWDRGNRDHQVTEEEAKDLATMVCRGALGCELKAIHKSR
ncbi:uncharacterized protein CTRU02_207821 [Colletotrichum truncatum]|uniref:Uncharacterized protein n=1 Tax=Colletotrichum truncatum TaxID=5467 RepID=A0ACC3Z1X7_COLTU|nr:uncharacterized protein CTRU02_15165 [Colletotrichum truncatum]KAF6781382.1 hypothetical protein CTRU02_15165 [Colletotrichum truncatum]